MDNQIYWRKAIGGKRPVAKRTFTILCGCMPIDIKKGTVGGLFDETSSLEENAWVGKGVRVLAGTKVTSKTYISGKDLILENVSFQDAVFIRTSGKIKNTKMSSIVSIKANRVDISDSSISNDVTISSGDEEGKNSVVTVKTAILSECVLRGNVTVVDSVIKGNVLVDSGENGHPEINAAEIKGDCVIKDNARISGEFFATESIIEGNVVFEKGLSARINRSKIRENAFLTGSNVVIFDSEISKNAKIGGNIVINDSIVQSDEELDFLSVSPFHHPLNIFSADIRHSGDIVTFYIGENEDLAVYKGKTGKATITSKNFPNKTLEKESEPADEIHGYTLDYVFRSSTEEKEPFTEWARWVQKNPMPEKMNGYIKEKYLRFKKEAGLSEADDNFMLSLITWSEISLAAAVLSKKKRGFGFLTRDEILDISKDMSSNVVLDIFSKDVNIKNSPVLLTISAIEAIAKRHGIKTEHLVKKLKNCRNCVFADFKIRV